MRRSRFPVSVAPWQRPRAVVVNGKPRFFEAKPVTDCRKSLALLLRQWWGPEPATGDLSVRMIIERARKRGARSGDIDNYCKTVLDAGTGVIWADDSQILFISCALAFSRDEDALVIEVSEYRGEL